MKNTILLPLLFFVINLTNAQTVETKRQAAETLWTNYDQDVQNPSKLPPKIPLTISNGNITQEAIPATYSALKEAMVKLSDTNGGIITFTNTAPATITFNEVNKAIDIIGKPFDGPYKTILIQGNNKITFNGSNSSSIFIIRRKLRIIIQDAIFQNAFLSRQVIQGNNFRTGGGAMEVSQDAYVRLYGCTFRNNNVAEWNDTPGGAYDGVGENQNGAALRLNFNTTAEIFNCRFENNKAVTGGAIGSTSINKITIMDCNFDKNVSTAYNTKNSTNRRIVEGAGALRVDRSKKPVEIYRTNFSENAANLKTSVIEVFIRPIPESPNGEYPNPDGNALIIADCTFKNNTYYNFQGAVDPERGDFFSGPILFHGGAINNNFRGAKMRVSNCVFDGNDISEGHFRTFLTYAVTNSIFANSNFLRLRNKQGQFRTGKAALFLRSEPQSISITSCTFYNNEPNTDDSTQFASSDIFFWGDGANASISNNIFYRKNTNPSFKQVSKPLKGSGNNQFVPGANMSQFNEVSTTASNKTDPNITPNDITDMCLGTNSLPQGIGGLTDCSVTDPNPGGSACSTTTTISGLSVNKTDTTATLTFTNLTSVKTYEVRAYVKGTYTGGVGGTFVWASGTSSPITINNLQSGTDYTIVLRAICSAGGTTQITTIDTNSGNDNPNPDETTCTTNATISGLNVNKTGTIATLTFTNLTGVKTYEVRAYVKGTYTGGVGGTFVWASGTSSPITINNLQSGTDYTIVLRAICSAGGATPIATIDTSSRVKAFNKDYTLTLKAFGDPTKINLSYPLGEEISLFIYTSTGQIIAKQTIPNTVSGNTIINFPSLTKGLYLVEARAGNKSKVIKVISQ